jgi:hypothetical protein
MTQEAYASSDIATGSWVRSTGSGSWFSHINSGLNTIYLSYADAGETIGEWGTPLETPSELVSYVRLVVQVKATGTFGRGFRVSLYEGATLRVSEQDLSPGTIGAWQFVTYDLSGAEKGSIGDWADLSMRVRVPSTGIAGTAFLASAYILAPDAGFEHLDVGSGLALLVVGAGSGHYLVPDGGGLKRIAGGEVAGALVLDAGGNVIVRS